ncbi:MAG: nitrogen fixation protein NifQ [Coriobacteriia bacterium]|nr:nitrogen fixation protein NifQ [Coriobacteriia bacterium]
MDAAIALITGPSGPESRFATAERQAEFDAIRMMLLAEATPGFDPVVTDAVARAVAAGCLGEQHLWRDLELANRQELRILLETCFEPFAHDNIMDMRWKKFIYRRLCRWGGFNTCKAPSCSACSSYSECFADEG